jgi:hypothetical protein
MDFSNVSIVTCFVNIYEKEPYQHKTSEWRMEQFRYIAATGLKICLYGCDKTTPYLQELVDQYPQNVKFMTLPFSFRQTPIYQMCYGEGLTFPERRNPDKDTTEYMALMNAKVEFVYDAVIKNPWNSKVFAWMDFSMAYIFGNKEATIAKMVDLLTRRNFIDRFIAFPGCWQPIPPNNVGAIINSIHWRFCGTFFIGDSESMIRLYHLYRKHFPLFLKEHKKIVWEVNFWAWLEANTDLQPVWYASDHNDRMINLPENIFV